MICLHYRDERERAQALVSLARRCQTLGAGLVFLGSAAAWAEARKAVGDLDPSALLGLTSRPVRHPEPEHGPDTWDATIERVRAALLEASVVGGPMVAWIESPAPPGGTPLVPALSAYYHALDATPVLATVICAQRLADLPEGARGAVLEACDAVINAKALLPHCPSWLVGPGAERRVGPAGRATRSGDRSVTPLEGVPSSPADSDLGLATWVQAEKLAALGQLAAGVAHELGNPLAIISSSLQYLHQRLAATNDAASDFTMTALANVDRMRGLLRSMLDFAAVKKPSFEPADLKEVVSEVLRFTAAECARRAVAVEVSFDPSLPRAWIEPAGVKQIILNLVQNGIDAMAQVGGTLKVRTRLDQADGMAVVEIANDGPAIPPDACPQLFRPFHTTKDGGTGLGLYLSRQIAKEHGGDLDAENPPDGGVRFTLTLPVDRLAGGESGEHGACPDRRR